MAIIGILTSTTLSADLKTSFETGFGGQPTYSHNSPREAKGKYDATGSRHKHLYRHVNILNGPPGAGQDGADVIVSFGGLVAAHAAVKRSQRPFLVLIGGVPNPSDFSLSDSDNYLGGVDLHSAVSNIERGSILMNQFPAAIATANQVYLLYNPNSRTGASEAREWVEHGFAAIPALMANEENSAADFTSAFNVMKSKGAKGAVISADPYFTSQKSPLVTAANQAAAAPAGGGFSLKICYPFDYYSTSAPPPTAGTGMYVGPKLSAAYQLMGQKARAISDLLDNGNPVEFQGFDTVAAVSTAIT